MIGQGLELLPALWRSEMVCAREVDGRGLCAVQPFIFSCGLLTRVTFDPHEWEWYGHAERYCYPTLADALAAIKEWDGQGDPPGPWIKEKNSDRLGPGARRRSAAR